MVRVIPLRESAITLGRDLSNQVVLVDPNISGHHAVVQHGPDGAAVRDLGSTNGTFVNDEAITSTRTLEHGDLLRLGPDVRLRIRRVGVGGSGHLVIRDATAGTLHLVEGDRFRIGSDPSCQIRLAQGPARAATLLVHGDGEVWLGTADVERPLDIGETFEVLGHHFSVELLAAEGGLAPTANPMMTTSNPYELTVTLDGGPGLAILREPGTERTCRMDAEQRVALLYLLGRQLKADREARVVPALAGWCHDEDLIVGVWGREALMGAASRYSVLLHRVRKDVEGAGLDPWCLEKRRGATRLQVRSVQLA